MKLGLNGRDVMQPVKIGAGLWGTSVGQSMLAGRLGAGPALGATLAAGYLLQRTKGFRDVGNGALAGLVVQGASMVFSRFGGGGGA